MSDSIGVFVTGTRASKRERSSPVEFGFEPWKSENSVTRTSFSYDVLFYIHRVVCVPRRKTARNMIIMSLDSPPPPLSKCSRILTSVKLSVLLKGKKTENYRECCVFL